ncbi:hypothetical protein, partial [Argonema antarcticum]|uniref:hypothetical protein n=1 Tax=Argonema antarcticum TaxID=2942763 RepID=UPI002012AC8F
MTIFVVIGVIYASFLFFVRERFKKGRGKTKRVWSKPVGDVGDKEDKGDKGDKGDKEDKGDKAQKKSFSF